MVLPPAERLSPNPETLCLRWITVLGRKESGFSQGCIFDSRLYFLLCFSSSPPPRLSLREKLLLCFAFICLSFITRVLLHFVTWSLRDARPCGNVDRKIKSYLFLQSAVLSVCFSMSPAGGRRQRWRHIGLFSPPFVLYTILVVHGVFWGGRALKELSLLPNNTWLFLFIFYFKWCPSP